MSTDPAPPEIQALAERRADARRARDWAAADRLKAEIEAAGWRVVDAATLWSLERAVAPTVEVDGRVRYGASSAVPSRLDDEPVGRASVVIAGDEGTDAAVIAGAVGAIAAHAPDGTQIVIVANGTSDGGEADLFALDRTDPGAPGIVTEVVWTVGGLTPAAAWNAGIRRAAAGIVVLLHPVVHPRTDVVGPLSDALADPGVAVAGPFGLVSDDLRRFSAAPGDASTVAAIDGRLLAFRRADYAARGPLDERFRLAHPLDAWWSLVLRDADEGVAARRAVQVRGLDLGQPPAPGAPDGQDDRWERHLRKDTYRLLKRFATRRDLLVAP